MDLQVGTELAGYRILSLLGRGGMGVVYLAEHLRLKRKVALKLLAPEMSQDPLFRERFIRESEVAASLDHPNIVPIYEADEVEGQLYIAMRYVHGTDLEALIREQGALEPQHVISVIHQLGGALDAAHVAGLVHRDVKPANVLIAPSTGSGPVGHMYLSDFGLTKQTETAAGRLTRSGQFVGSVDYMAPEQIEGKPLDGRADVYSLGCVAFECLIGQPPFRKDGDVAVMYAHLKDPPPRVTERRAELPEAVDEVLSRAMAKRAEDRYQKAGELATALQDAITPPTSPGPSVPSPLARRGPRRPVLIAIAAGGVAVVAVVVALVVSGGGDGNGPGPPDGSPETPAAIDNAVARIDAETGRVEVTATGVVDGTDIAFGEGGVWVVTRGHRLNHFDPETGTHLTPVSFSCTSAAQTGTDVVVGGGDVWISSGGSCGAVKVNPATDEESDRVPELPASLGGQARLAFGGGKLWVLSSGQLLRVDPFRTRVEANVDLGGGEDVAFGEGTVWVGDSLTERLLRVVPDTMEVIDSIELPSTPNNLAVGAGQIWVLNRSAGTVTEVSLSDGNLGNPIRVGSDPLEMIFGLDSVWVANHGDGTVTRIDTLTRRVITIDVGGPPTSLAIDEETKTIWVTIASCEDLGRGVTCRF